MMATHTNKDSRNITHLIRPDTIGAEIGVWMGNTSTLFLKNKIKKTATDVGENFPTEARAMHYGEKEAKPIIGNTTLEEARDLAEEGIPLAPVRWNDDKLN